MPRFSTRYDVSFSPEHMFALVADIEKYPEFVPLCEALTIRQRTKNVDGTEVLLADMRVGYKAIQESFVSRVTLNATQLTIRTEYVEGPFKFLDNRWTFQATQNGCRIDFFIAYEFKNRMLGLLMGAMFDRAFRKFVQAFETRAHLLKRKKLT
jgi:coenzyme Q-binding protein COQ10